MHMIIFILQSNTLVCFMSQPNHWMLDVLNNITQLNHAEMNTAASLHIKRTSVSPDSAHITVADNSRHFDPASHLNVVRATSTTGPLKIIIISWAVDIMNCDNALLVPCPTVKMFYYVGGYSHMAHWNFLIKVNQTRMTKGLRETTLDHSNYRYN